MAALRQLTPPTGVENDELNSELIMLTVGSVRKGIYEFVCTGSSLRIDDPLRFISVNYIGKSFFEKNCHFNMIQIVLVVMVLYCFYFVSE